MGAEASAFDSRSTRDTRTRGEYSLISESSEFAGGPCLSDNGEDSSQDDESNFKGVREFRDLEDRKYEPRGPGIWERRWREVVERLDKAEEERAEIRRILCTLHTPAITPSRNLKRRATISDTPSSSSDAESMESGLAELKHGEQSRVGNLVEIGLEHDRVKSDSNMLHTGSGSNPIGELDDIEFEDGYSEDGSVLIEFGEDHPKPGDM